MEEAIIKKVKDLLKNGQQDLTSCVKQAINEVGSQEQLRDIYSLFNITFEDYVEYIKRQVQNANC